MTDAHAYTVDPREVAYFEGHGTGTAVGDPTEIRALAAAHGPRRGPRREAPELTPREAEITDPQHRLFLEACWEALEAL